MQLDTAKMLAKIKNTQWALADIDWDAPGAELVTGDPELYAKLKVFMADLMWIEHVGARLRGDGQEGAGRHARRDLPLLPRRGAEVTPMPRWR